MIDLNDINLDEIEDTVIEGAEALTEGTYEMAPVKMSLVRNRQDVENLDLNVYFVHQGENRKFKNIAGYFGLTGVYSFDKVDKETGDSETIVRQRSTSRTGFARFLKALGFSGTGYSLSASEADIDALPESDAWKGADTSILLNGDVLDLKGKTVNVNVKISAAGRPYVAAVSSK